MDYSKSVPGQIKTNSSKKPKTSISKLSEENSSTMGDMCYLKGSLLFPDLFVN